MKRAIAVLRAGAASDRPGVDTLLLDYDQRQQPRGVHKALRGTEVEMALTHPVRLRTDDRLVLDDDTLVDIVARPEPLYELRAANPSDLARLAWMLGDRHCPVDISERRLRVRRDPAIAAWIGHTAVKVAAIEAPFEPEGGAYSHDVSDASAHDHSPTHCDHDHQHR